MDEGKSRSARTADVSGLRGNRPCLDRGAAPGLPRVRWLRMGETGGRAIGIGVWDRCTADDGSKAAREAWTVSPESSGAGESIPRGLSTVAQPESFRVTHGASVKRAAGLPAIGKSPFSVLLRGQLAPPLAREWLLHLLDPVAGPQDHHESWLRRAEPDLRR